MKEPYQHYAEDFKPKKIKFLLIGESPPLTPEGQELRYFYNYKNNVGRNVLLSTISFVFIGRGFRKGNNKKEFLNKLCEKGVFLVDATYTPINKKNKKERREIIKEDYPSLKKNILNLNLSSDTKFFLIHNNVVFAIGEMLRNDFKQYEIISIGFPKYYDDRDFKEKIEK